MFGTKKQYTALDYNHKHIFLLVRWTKPYGFGRIVKL